MTLYEVFQQVLEMSKTASFVILIIIFVRLLLKKAPKAYSYALWGIVLFRLLCPVSFTSDFSLLNLKEKIVQETERVEYLSKETVSVDAIWTESYDSSQEHTANNNVQFDNIDNFNVQLLQKSEQPFFLKEVMITSMWLMGILALDIYNIVQVFLLRKRLVGAVPIERNIYLADHIDSPFVMGLFRPQIYLPSSSPEEEREYIILHEQHHVKRKDPVFKFLYFIALSVHWFNPLVWLSFKWFNQDMEMSCDEAVMKKIGKDIRAEYSTSLLRFAVNKRNVVAPSIAFGEGEAKSRVKNIMKYQNPVISVTIISMMVIAITAVLLLSDPPEKNSTLVGAEYSVEEILYDVSGKGKASDKPIHCIAADYNFYVQFPSDQWDYRGKLEAFDFSNQELMEAASNEEAWFSSEKLSEITDAYILRMDGARFYIAMQTKDGETLIGYGSGYKDLQLEWLYKVASEFEEHHIQTNFFDRSLKYSINANVDCFAYHESDKIPGFLVIGFVADTKTESREQMRDMGFAVFQSFDGKGYKLLDYHVYDRAAITNNRIYHAEYPAVADVRGDVRDDNTYNVILSCNPNLKSIKRVLDDGTELVESVESEYSMTLLWWEDEKGSETVSLYFLDEEGNEISSNLTEKTYSITEPYQYQEDIGNHRLGVTECQIPEDILVNMTTEALIETVMNYPYLIDMFLASTTVDDGLEWVKEDFNGLKELFNREDAAEKMQSYFEGLDKKEIENAEQEIKRDMAEVIWRNLKKDE